jgi:hypothetical protein
MVDRWKDCQASKRSLLDMFLTREIGNGGDFRRCRKGCMRPNARTAAKPRKYPLNRRLENLSTVASVSRNVDLKTSRLLILVLT